MNQCSAGFDEDDFTMLEHKAANGVHFVNTSSHSWYVHTMPTTFDTENYDVKP